jgi:hypothetical protein
MYSEFVLLIMAPIEYLICYLYGEKSPLFRCLNAPNSFGIKICIPTAITIHHLRLYSYSIFFSEKSNFLCYFARLHFFLYCWSRHYRYLLKEIVLSKTPFYIFHVYNKFCLNLKRRKLMDSQRVILTAPREMHTFTQLYYS